MTGHGYTKTDPAVERWNLMRESAYKHFRFTRKTTSVALWSFLIIPGTLLYISRAGDAKWNWAGKLKGEALAIKPPAQTEAASE